MILYLISLIKVWFLIHQEHVQVLLVLAGITNYQTAPSVLHQKCHQVRIKMVFDHCIYQNCRYISKRSLNVEIDEEMTSFNFHQSNLWMVWIQLYYAWKGDNSTKRESFTYLCEISWWWVAGRCNGRLYFDISFSVCKVEVGLPVQAVAVCILRTTTTISALEAGAPPAETHSGSK